MSIVDPTSLAPTPATPTSGKRAPTAAARALGAIPRSIQYLLLGMAVVVALASVRAITDATPLTGVSTFRSALMLSLPVALAGLGGLWAERAGVVNIGLEGMMVLGTWFGAWGGITYGPWQGVALGIVGGAIGGLVHSVATVTFGVDHIVSGVAINLLGDGVTRFLTNVTYEGSDKSSPTVPKVTPNFDIPLLSDLAEFLAKRDVFLVSDVGRILTGLTTQVNAVVVLGLLMFPLSYWVLWRTRIGLRLRSIGEDPVAAESLGVKVYSLKYLAVMVSGALSGLGGVTLVYVFGKQFQVNQTGGRGFIGLAAMIFGNWRPGGLAMGAGLFGFTDSLQSQSDATSHALLLFVAILVAGLAIRALVQGRYRAGALIALAAAGVFAWYTVTNDVPTELIPYIPHMTTLAVLVFASQRLRPPAAEGKVYRRGGT